MILRKTIFILLFMIICMAGFGKHIIGGEMFYEYLGEGSAAGFRKFKITLKLFRDEHSPADAAPMPPNVYIGIFDLGNRAQYPGPGRYFDVILSRQERVTVNELPPCITNAPDLYYTAGYYTLTIDLPVNEKGYAAAYQTCCRISPLSNVNTFGGTGTGATYSCEIPPENDSSPQFKTSIDAICGGKPFSLDFSAVDANADSLVYAFADAYDGGSFRNASNGNPAPPPYSAVPYMNGHLGSSPLGHETQIDERTGIISGLAPATGRYVVCVEVLSYKEGKLINRHRKDFIVNVNNCDFAGARLNPKPVSCESFEVMFLNDDPSPLNKTFYWDFGDPASGEDNFSTLAAPVHVYSDTGVYKYKLVVNRGEQCSDSAIQTVRVYPGFSPNFDVSGRCIGSPISFTDRSTTNYGEINSWTWKFNDDTNLGDTSNLPNPTYVFSKSGTYNVTLSISSTKGCVSDVDKVVTIVEQPPLSLTEDTLICHIDELQLTAEGEGRIRWTPDYNISNTQSFRPVVFPKVPTTYYARLEESPGCVATDSVFIDVVPNVQLESLPDTTICLSDTIQLKPYSNALHYSWEPPNGYISDPTAAHPFVAPVETTTYHLTASIGKCFTRASYVVHGVPYPAAEANADVTICAGESLQLQATGGQRFFWSPPLFLSHTNTANPVAKPAESIRYIVRVEDDLGCPKPAYDTVNIFVEKTVARISVKDTSVVINQPLQLIATGGEYFSWSPSEGLSNPQIYNPLALPQRDIDYVLRTYSNAGCEAFDTVRVKVFKVKPGFYIPDAFTPNGDGHNDVFRPILLGMKQLKHFKIFNRSGLQIYETSRINQGWNGTYHGIPQDSGVFVWLIEGEDYQGNKIFEKGSVTLIR